MIAIYIDKKIRAYENQVKYAFDFIFRTLGYEYKYIKTADEILSNEILIYYGMIHPTLEEAYQIVFRKIMFYLPFESELYDYRELSANKLRNCTLELPDGIPVYSTSEIFEAQTEKYSGLYYCSFGFDLVGNIFFQLNNAAQHVFGKEEVYDNNFETYNDIPFVNHYLQKLEAELKSAYAGQHRYFLIKKEQWPQAEKMAVAISHTIDSLKKWDIKSILKISFLDLLNFYRVNYFFKNFISKSKYLLTNFEEYWDFDLINELESEYKLRSTYFLGSDTLNSKSFDYDVEDEDLLDELQKIKERQCEIALLAPAYSQKADVYASQKKIICELTNRTKIGVRQQNQGYDSKVTAQLHEKNHFHYDSSQYYSQTSGFKNGIASVYRHFRELNPQLSEERSLNPVTNHLEIPVAFAAGTLRLSKFSNIPFDKAKSMLDSLIENAAASNGLFAYDFSLSAFADIPYCAELFRYIQKKIAHHSRFQATYGEIADWCKKRDSVYIREKNRRIKLYFPHAVEHITFQILGEHKFYVADHQQVEIIKQRLIFHNVPSDSNITIILEAPDNRESVNSDE